MGHHKTRGEELPPEVAKAMVDAVRHEMLSGLESKLLLAGRSRGAGESPSARLGLRVFDLRQGINLYDEVQRYEIQLIRWALQQAHGKQVMAARLLGIRATTLNNKIKHYRIDWKEEPSSSEAEAE